MLVANLRPLKMSGELRKLDNQVQRQLLGVRRPVSALVVGDLVHPRLLKLSFAIGAGPPQGQSGDRSPHSKELTPLQGVDALQGVETNRSQAAREETACDRGINQQDELPRG
jgi:hypothetical protein